MFFEERCRCLLMEACPTIYLRVGHPFSTSVLESSTITMFSLCRLQPCRLGQHAAIGLPVVPRICQPVAASLPLNHGIQFRIAPGSTLRRHSCTLPRRCRRPREAIALRCRRARPAACGFSPQRHWGLSSTFPASSGGGGAFVVVPRAIVIAPPEVDLHGHPTSRCIRLRRLPRHPDGDGPG